MDMMPRVIVALRRQRPSIEMNFIRRQDQTVQPASAGVTGPFTPRAVAAGLSNSSPTSIVLRGTM
jgi:hypothetical protein